MQKDEAKLVQLLRAIDGQSPFDAGAFAQRVIVERSRRRKRRLVSASCATAALLLVGLAWYGFHDSSPQLLVNKDASETGSDSIDHASEEARMDGTIDSRIVEFTQEEHELNSLLYRIERATATMAASQEKQNRQMLAAYRAELSGKIAVPDLSQLYGSMANDRTN